ncbi:MAG: hypothetical protein COW55_11060 [Rhodobacteraceae bacterium CG17_big_fil_post_rev_8_21_14_2_50_65_11]|nr:MAG: hypothetical protein COW55_11060 [Rhodobacteraceae bacterium CG17_big_fil_post_rev_8_21_14_2_50_65_11]
MPIAIPPLAGIAVRYAGVALVGYALARGTARGRRDERLEDIMDATPEGATLHSEAGQVNAGLRWRRLFRPGPAARGLELDATLLARLKLRHRP